ncbi:hypothetical protein SAMN02910339_01695 [Lachnospiraceae bacterium YSD2013]|nr:hypothetical protein SAMN02910339_01695 [Lachnospiraceae bacterium YSD2013]
MNSKRAFIAFLVLILFLCGCGKADSIISTETSVTISESSHISEAEETEIEEVDTQETHISKEEAIQAIFDYSPEGVAEPGEDAEKGIEYYVSTAQNIYELPYWKAFGIASLALDIIPTVSEEEVVAFIDRGEQLGFESLFEGFFWDRYSDAETIEYAKAYAYYLTEHVLKSHSFTEFMSDNYREEWLKANGSKSEYVYDSIDELLDTGKSEYVDGCYAFCIGIDQWVCGKESWIHDASELYDLIHDSEGEFRIVVQDMKNDAPTWYENLGKNKKNISIVLYDDEIRSFTDTTNKEAVIYLSGAPEAPHEYVHALVLGQGRPYIDGWISEGVAVRYSLKFMDDGLEAMDGIYEVITADDIKTYLADNGWGHPDDTALYFTDVKEKYLDLKTKYGDEYTDKIYVAMAVGQQEIADKEAIPGWSLAERSGGSERTASHFSYAAMHLSYFGSAVATDLLIKEFGADKVMTFLYVTGDFNTEFGITQQEFIEKINQDGSYKDAFLYVE